MKQFFKEISKALKAYKKAHQLIIKHKLYYWILVPIVLNIISFFGFVSISWYYADQFTDWLYQLINLSALDWGRFDFLLDVFRFLFDFILRLLMVLVYFTFYKYLILFFLAPLLAYLSDKTEELYTGKAYPFEIGSFLYNAFRGAVIALRNIIFELSITLLFALTSFIPLVGILSPVFIFLTESYFFGYSMIDYYCERKKMNISEGTRFIQKHFSFTIANGAIFNLVFLLPSFLAVIPLLFFSLLLKYLFIIPVVVLSVLPIYSIVAATIGILDVEKNKIHEKW